MDRRRVAGILPDASLTELTDAYTEGNPGADRKRVSRVLERLRKIIKNHVGIIELAEDLEAAQRSAVVVQQFSSCLLPANRFCQSRAF